MCDKKYCTNCVRWYGQHKSLELIDQCDIPASGYQYKDEPREKQNFLAAKGELDWYAYYFINTKLKYVFYTEDINGNKMIYGHPSQLNWNNDCYFYLEKEKKEVKKEDKTNWSFIYIVWGIAITFAISLLFIIR